MSTLPKMKPRKPVVDKTVKVRYIDVDVELYADDFDIEDVRAIIAENGWTPAQLAADVPATAPMDSRNAPPSAGLLRGSDGAGRVIDQLIAAGPGKARHGGAGPGNAQPGVAWRGMARHGYHQPLKET